MLKICSTLCGGGARLAGCSRPARTPRTRPRCSRATRTPAAARAGTRRKRWRRRGTLHAGGLDGSFRAVQDLADGRSVGAYKLGPIEGADGYDGTLGWSRDPGGEVAALDAPDGEAARAQPGLARRARLLVSGAHRRRATAGRADREVDGRRYAVVEATPEGGDPIGAVVRCDERTCSRAPCSSRARTPSTTVFDDYREVDGVRLPFHAVTDLTDAAGPHRSAPAQRDAHRARRAERRDRRRRLRDAGNGADRAHRRRRRGHARFRSTSSTTTSMSTARSTASRRASSSTPAA